MRGEREHRKDEWKGEKVKIFFVSHSCFSHLKNPKTCLHFHRVRRALCPNCCFSAFMFDFGTVGPALNLLGSCFFPASSCLLIWVKKKSGAKEAQSLISKAVTLEKQRFLSMLELGLHFPIMTLLEVVLDTQISWMIYGLIWVSHYHFVTFECGHKFWVTKTFGDTI